MTKLCDVILHEPSVIPVINRFGIILGVGDKSIRTVCEEKNLDCEFFVTILNTFINEDYFPENRLKSFCATQIVNYLTQTNAYYEQFQIPNIERHFNFLINQSDSENNNLELMKQFFDELKKELLSRIENDKNCWFPSIKVAAETLHGEYYGEKFQPDTEENDSLEGKIRRSLKPVCYSSKRRIRSQSLPRCHIRNIQSRKRYQTTQPDKKQNTPSHCRRYVGSLPKQKFQVIEVHAYRHRYTIHVT